MVVLLVESDVSETYANDPDGGNVFPIALAPDDTDVIIDSIDALTPDPIHIDASDGMGFIQIFASTLDDIPNEISDVVTTLTEVTVTTTNEYVIVTLPPDEASDVVARTKDVFAEP